MQMEHSKWKSPTAFLSASLLGSKIQTMYFAQQWVVPTWNLQVGQTKYFPSIRDWRTLPPRTTPLFPWPRTPFKPPGAISPLPDLLQQCWSPAPPATSSPSPSSHQTTCVPHSNPDWVCLWGDPKYWVLVLPSVPPQLPCSCLRQWDASSVTWGLLFCLPYPPFLGHFLFWKQW